jgi:hypothetical protein
MIRKDPFETSRTDLLMLCPPKIQITRVAVTVEVPRREKKFVVMSGFSFLMSLCN